MSDIYFRGYFILHDTLATMEVIIILQSILSIYRILYTFMTL